MGGRSGAGRDFVQAFDIRFAEHESAILSELEPAFGVLPSGEPPQCLMCDRNASQNCKGI